MNSQSQQALVGRKKSPSLAITLAASDQMTIKAWLRGKQPSTIEAYQRDALHMLATVGKPLPTVATSDLSNWLDMLADMSRSTRHRKVAAMKSLFRVALDLGHVNASPAASLRVEKPQITTEDRWLTQTEMVRLLAAEDDPRLHALLRLLYVCALRASEACNLRWRDMTGSPKKGGTARILGKGAKLRTVDVPAALWRELADLYDGPPAQNSPVVFARAGGILGRTTIHRAVKRAARRAKLRKTVSAHVLRHSRATHASENGCPPHELRATMGHASLDTTTRYLHVKPGGGSSNYIKG